MGTSAINFIEHLFLGSIPDFCIFLDIYLVVYYYSFNIIFTVKASS